MCSLASPRLVVIILETVNASSAGTHTLSCPRATSPSPFNFSIPSSSSVQSLPWLPRLPLRPQVRSFSIAPQNPSFDSLAISISLFVVVASEAVQVLVNSLGDESSVVRGSAMAAIEGIAALNPLLVLDCCFAVSRGGRRVLCNLFQVFYILISATRSLINFECIPNTTTNLCWALSTSSVRIYGMKSDDASAQRRSMLLLYSILTHSSRLLMMEEIFLHLRPNSALPAMVQILADFAAVEALQFTPRLKDVLSRVLPIVGNVKDVQRPIFANAFKYWCEAVWQYRVDYPTHPLLDSDVMSFLNSAFELLLRVWASSRDLKVRVASVEALGQMFGLVSRVQLKGAIPRIMPTILDLYKKDQEISFVATHSLLSLLNASLLSETGPPLLEFEELITVLSTLLPVVSIHDSKGHSNFSVGLKMYNEVQHCFLTVGLVYHEDLFVFLLNKCRLKEDPVTYGALCVLKHLLPRLSEPWHAKIPLLVEAVKMLLDEQGLCVRKALSELIVVMASHCYLVGPSGELFVEYLVRHCAISDEELENWLSRKKKCFWMMTVRSNLVFHQVRTGFPTELRAICGKGLLLLTITIPEMEPILWPFLLKMIIPRTYTGAVSTVCRCISELCRRRSSYVSSLLSDYKTRSDLPKPEEIFARLVVLLHDPLAEGQLATQILTVFCYLGSLFPKNIILFWQDEIPKMKAYIGDPEDLKQDSSYQETWDDMIINFLAESLDVIEDTEWVISLGNAFSEQYELYTSRDEHSALLHRCLGILLQKVGDRTYVREKIDWMYEQANIAVPTNRVGLAKGMGLVAASHLDTVLEKLKDILDNIGHNIFQRILAFFSEKVKVDDADDIHAALALMYGYAARYAPSTVIEARIDALVGTNMLSRLLHVRLPTAKQAVITAIDLLGCAVITAAESGASFPLKRRDLMLDYILTLMGREESDGYPGSNLELLHTQTLALSACTTLVSVEPKLTVETRNYVMKATLGFFALPNDPSEVIDPLINNLITLLCAILLTSGEDGRSRTEQLLHILRQIDQYVSSSAEHQRRRGCVAVHEMLLKFRTLCSSGYCALGCHGSCMHSGHVDRILHKNISSLPSSYALPTRVSLCLGERVVVYLPRCADTNSEVRKLSAQILDLFFSISLSLPRPTGSPIGDDIEMSYRALSSLEDVIAILRSDASIDELEVFNRVVSSVCVLLTRDELVATLFGSTAAICDKVKQSAAGSIQAVIEFVAKRGMELNENDISRTTQALLSATMLVNERYLRQEILGAISCLAENTSSKIVFNEVLTAAGRDIVTKDITRLRGGWPMQDAFIAFSQHTVLSLLFLEHLVSVLNQTPILKGDIEKGENSSHSFGIVDEDILQATLHALTALFRGGGKVGKKAVLQSYAEVFSALTLQLGSCHILFLVSVRLEILRYYFVHIFFCNILGKEEAPKVVAVHSFQVVQHRWRFLLLDLVVLISIKHPTSIKKFCSLHCKFLTRSHIVNLEVEQSAYTFGDGVGSLLEEVVERMCQYVSDESPTVRRLCLRGLVQIPSIRILQHVIQVLGVVLSLLEDSDESVQLTAVQCLLTVLESSPKEAVDPVLLNLSIRLRYLQICVNGKMRANAFAAFGSLSKYGDGAHHEAFLEQVHVVLPRLILHVHDDDLDVRQACRSTLRQIATLIETNGMVALFNGHSFNSDHRGDYEDFVRDLTRQLCQNFPSRAGTYMESVIQSFDAPWPTIQANAVYFSSSMLSHSDDPRILAPYLTQVFGMLVGKMNQSPDAIVRASCSSAIALLLKCPNLVSWRSIRLDRADSAPKGNE
ncbi:hypothetical protein Syun_000686 [Stephania yunnanensis]|uniref:Protein SHOOT GRAVITROPISM 6 n=1 Tax=Stephania yunnanensis TaxID=152371 RepID=A0AAP0LCK3_9MAGN